MPCVGIGRLIFQNLGMMSFKSLFAVGMSQWSRESVREWLRWLLVLWIMLAGASHSLP
jgi:hypothetical protein